ncbi:hypothetical protein ASD15_29380 [Massilia sp. Root351]|nr:hypothetical protein ASD15_29380 [Massilia sp. Root351]
MNFCPFCGTRQAAAGAPARAAVPPTAPPTAPPARTERPGSVGVQKTANVAGAAGVAGSAEPAAAREAGAGHAKAGPDAAPAGGEAPKMTQEQIAAAQARLNKVRGVPPAGTVHAPPTGGARPKAGPPMRQPIGIGTWVLVAMILAVIWYLAKPANKEERIAERVAQAEKLAAECKLDDARTELASLRTDKAPAAQIRRVNEAINSAILGCEKKRQRAKAWADLKPVLENAAQTGAVATADARLSAFTKKWGADDDTREWDKRLDGLKTERLLDEAEACHKKPDLACMEAKLLAAEKMQRAEFESRIRSLRDSLSKLLEATVLEQKAPPAASLPPPAIANQPPRGAAVAPPPPVISTVPQAAQAAQQARKILADAERELNQGNYKGAMDKAEICATMIDVGNRECLGLKQRAERLNREMLRCVASGADWINDRCQ